MILMEVRLSPYCDCHAHINAALFNSVGVVVLLPSVLLSTALLGVTVASCRSNTACFPS